MAKSRTSDNPATFLKPVKAAEKDLTALKGSVDKVGKLLKQEKLTEKKLKPVVKRALRVMEKHKGVAALLSTPGFNSLPKEMQEGVIRVEDLINTLQGLTQDLARTLKLMKKSPEGDYALLIKAAKPNALQIKQAPRHVGQLVKAIKKGQEIGGTSGFSVALLPALILLWLIGETTMKGLKSK